MNEGSDTEESNYGWYAAIFVAVLVIAVIALIAASSMGLLDNVK